MKTIKLIARESLIQARSLFTAGITLSLCLTIMVISCPGDAIGTCYEMLQVENAMVDKDCQCESFGGSVVNCGAATEVTLPAYYVCDPTYEGNPNGFTEKVETLTIIGRYYECNKHNNQAGLSACYSALIAALAAAGITTVVCSGAGLVIVVAPACLTAAITTLGLSARGLLKCGGCDIYKCVKNPGSYTNLRTPRVCTPLGVNCTKPGVI